MTYRRLTSPGRSRRAERSRTSAPSIGRVRRGRLGWRALERGVVAEHQDDDDADDGAEGEEDQPGLVGAAPVAQQAEDLRAEIAAEIADRIDGGDAAAAAVPLSSAVGRVQNTGRTAKKPEPATHRRSILRAGAAATPARTRPRTL